MPAAALEKRLGNRCRQTVFRTDDKFRRYSRQPTVPSTSGALGPAQRTGLRSGKREGHDAIYHSGSVQTAWPNQEVGQ